jgi:acyl-CoA hydrolase
MPYSEIGALLQRTEFDLAIVHAAPPDEQGFCSFGIACDAPGIVWPRATKRIAFLNRAMPRIPRSDAIPLEQIDFAVEIDSDLLSPQQQDTSDTIRRIARHAVNLIPDGATIQSGIGETPGAVIASLTSHKRLRAHSGIVTSEYYTLAEAGALNANVEHIGGIAWGGQDFYRWLGEQNLFAFRSIRETHGYDRIARLPRFHSIGSALEVDLAGNINLEWRGGRRVSSVGGAPDYIRGAAASPGGLAIIALPSIAANGASRIVSRLLHVSIAPPIMAVVTEYGAVRLDGISGKARADALIAIAAPEHRDALASKARGAQG